MLDIASKSGPIRWPTGLTGFWQWPQVLWAALERLHRWLQTAGAFDGWYEPGWDPAADHLEQWRRKVGHPPTPAARVGDDILRDLAGWNDMYHRTQASVAAVLEAAAGWRQGMLGW